MLKMWNPGRRDRRLLATACQKSAHGAGRRRLPPPPVTVNQPLSRDVVEWDEYPGPHRGGQIPSKSAPASPAICNRSISRTARKSSKATCSLSLTRAPIRRIWTGREADLLQARTRFELASNDLARAGRLLKAKAISEEEADSRAKAEREAAAGHPIQPGVGGNGEAEHGLHPRDGARSPGASGAK